MPLIPAIPKVLFILGFLGLPLNHLHTFATAYLSSLVHTAAVCDRCMTCIEGAWFRCCYCQRDLCDACQEVDTHDDTHIFLVFKSIVSVLFLKTFSYSNIILIMITALG